METLTFTRVPSDACGNPRYVVHYLKLCTLAELEDRTLPSIINRYALVVKRARVTGRQFVAEV